MRFHQLGAAIPSHAKGTCRLRGTVKETIEGQQPNCDCARSAHSNTPDIDARRHISSNPSLTKLMCQRLEVVAELPAVVSQGTVCARRLPGGSERVEDCALVLLQNPAASDYET